MDLQWSLPLWMWPLLLIVAAGAIVWTVTAYRQTRPEPSTRLRRGLTALRTTALVLLILAAAGPVLSHLRQSTVPAELVVVLEDSGSMALPAAAATDTTDLSRWQRALAVAADLDSIFSRNDPAVNVVLLRGNGLESLQEIRLDDAVVPAPRRHGTALTTLLRQVRRRTLGRPVRGIVLMSDGQETGARSRADDRSGRADAIQAVPVFTVGLGDERGAADRVIKDLRHPDTAYQGDEVILSFVVDHRHLAATPLDPLVVTLTGAQGLVASDTLTGTGLVPVELSFVPGRPGLQAFRLRVSPLPNERYLANNEMTLAVDVRKERARVLVLAQTPGWNVRFLAQAAAREQRLELAVVYRNESGLVFADSLSSWRPPVSAAEWRVWDAVVLTGWQGPLADLDWSVLDQAVQDGLGLVVLPGAADRGHGSLALPPPAALAEILPVDAPRWRWLDGPVFGRMRGDAAGHPVLDGLGTSGGRPAGDLLADLPPLREWAAAQPRSGSTVLLEGVVRGPADPQAVRPILVAAARGDGRTAWFGARHVWEWAFWESGVVRAEPDGEQPARRLLRNLLVWAAAGSDDTGLAFSGQQALFHEGEPIRLAARWHDLRGRPVVGRRLSVVLRPAQDAEADTTGRTFTMRPAARSPGLAEVQLPALPPGEYTARLVGQGQPPVQGTETSLIVTDTSVERTQVRLDRRRLEQLADGQGVFAVAADNRVPAALLAGLADCEWNGQTSVGRDRLDVWSGWPFLVLVTLLLGCEWFLRRRHGML